MTKNSVKIVNRSDGITHNDVWYSNYYSFIKSYRKHQNEAKKHSIKISVPVIEDHG